MKVRVAETLRERYGIEDWAVIVQSIQPVSLLWDYLTIQENLDSVISFAGSDVARWAPAQIALFILTGENPAHGLLTLRGAVSERISREGLAALENSARWNDVQTRVVPEFRDSALLGLGLHHHWAGTQDILRLSAAIRELSGRLIESAFACLFGLIDNPNAFLHTWYEASADKNDWRLGLIAVQGQPLPFTSKVTQMTVALSGLPATRQLAVVEYLSGTSERLAHAVASQLANRALASSPPEKGIESLAQDLYVADLLQYSQRFQEALPLIDAAWQKSRDLQADLASRIAEAASWAKDLDAAQTALAQADRILPEDRVRSSARNTARLHTGQLDPSDLGGIADNTDLSKVSLSSLIVGAKLHLGNRDVTKSEQLALAATSRAMEDESILNHVRAGSLIELAKTLLAVGHPVKAREAINRVIALDSGNSLALLVATEIELEAAHPEDALRNAYHFRANDPGNIESIRLLALALAANQRWGDSLQEWQLLLEQDIPRPPDLLFAARAALEVANPSLAASLCQRAMSMDASLVEGHFLLGSALAILGDKAGAMARFDEANRLQPGYAEAWIARVELLMRSGENDRAAQVVELALRNSISDYRLGTLHGELLNLKKRQKEARFELGPAYQAFANLDSSGVLSALKSGFLQRLSEALALAGDVTKAVSVLRLALRCDPDNVSIHLILSRHLADSGQMREAIRLLSSACSVQPRSAELHSALLDLLLTEHSDEIDPGTVLAQLKEIDPKSSLIPLYQAELSLSSGSHSTAFNKFKQLLSQNIYTESMQYSRLIMGFTRAALKLGNPEVAITALKENWADLATSPRAYMLQIESHLCANLSTNAIAFMREFVEKFPGDTVAIIWAAEKAAQLGQVKLQIDILETAAQHGANTPQIFATLAQAYAKNGEVEKGKKVLFSLFELEEIDSENIRRAAGILFDMGDPTGSLQYLQEGLKLNNHQSTVLLSGIVEINLKTGAFAEALTALEELIALDPENIEYILLKSDVLLSLEKPQSAILLLQDATEGKSAVCAFHIKLAEIQRNLGEPVAAWQHIQRAQPIEPASDSVSRLRAELAYLCCLESDLDNTPTTNAAQTDSEWQLFQSERALEASRDIIASSTITSIAGRMERDPRLLAIQSRLANRIGQQEQAIEHLAASMEAYATETSVRQPATRSAMLRGISAALLELEMFDSAMFCLREACKLVPFEPINHFLLARALVIRAERKHLCNALGILMHAPGPHAIHIYASESFAAAIAAALELAPAESKPGLERWLKRGRLSLGDEEIHNPFNDPQLLEDAGFLAAALAATRRAKGRAPDIRIPDTEDYAAARLQSVVSLIATEPTQALQAAQALHNTGRQHPETLALSALAAKAARNPTLSLEYISKALSIWPNEPKWHTLAGSLNGELELWSNASLHFEQALASDKADLDVRLRLAEAYLQDNAPWNSMRVLEDARKNDSSNPEVWRLMAEAASRAGDLLQARTFAGKWAAISPTDPVPLALQSQIAFELSEYESSIRFSNKAQELAGCPPSAQSYAAKSLSQLGRHEEALEVLGAMNEHADLPVHSLLEQAELVRQLKGEDAAYQFLLSLSEEKRSSPVIMAAIASELTRQKKLHESIELLLRALQGNLEDVTAQDRSAIHLQLGALLRETGHLDQALHHLTQSVALVPGLAAAYLELAETHHLRRESHLAVETLRKAIAVSPNFIPAYSRTGELLMESKDYSGAEALLKRASTLAPQDPDIRRQLGAVIAMNLVHRPHPAG